MSYEFKMICIDKPLKILNTKENVLRMKTIPMGKVLKMNHTLEEATRKGEANITGKYHSFSLS